MTKQRGERLITFLLGKVKKGKSMSSDGTCKPYLPFSHRLLYYLLTAEEEEPESLIGFASRRLDDFEEVVLNSSAFTNAHRTVRTSNSRDRASSLPSLAKIIASGHYRLTLTVKAKATGQIVVTNTKLDAEYSPTLIDRELAINMDNDGNEKNSSMQLIVVIFSYESKVPVECIHRLASEGFRFLDRGCFFFASKDPETRKAFFLLCKDRISLQNTPSDASGDCDCFVSALCAQDLRQKFGSFNTMKNLPLAGARCGLLVSGSLEGLRRAENTVNIIMHDDIYGTRAGASTCLTDGSGFISKNLARAMPQSVMQGKIGIENNIPAAFQVRVFVPSMGVFKGTLVVKESLEDDSIVLRPSMHKVKRQNPCESDNNKNNCDTNQIVVEIVNTSRAPRYHSSTLNHQLLHALHSRGVDFEVFEDILHKRVKLISNMCDSREQAVRYFREIESCKYKGLRKKLKSQGDGGVGSEKGELENDRQRSILLSMLLSNHSIHDPFIQSSLRMLRDREVDDMLNLKLPISPAVYLMGIPDPTGLLRGNEVYVGRDRDHDIHAGDMVCITRFPLIRSKAIQLFRVVEQYSEARQQLDAFFGGRDGVVVFATGAQHRVQNHDIGECPVSSMSGDYDGDLYFITSHKGVVKAFIEKNPREYSLQPEDELLRRSDISSKLAPNVDGNEVSLVFDLPLSPGIDSLSIDQYRDDSSILMPAITSVIRPVVGAEGSERWATSHNDECSDNMVVSLLKSSPENLTPEELNVAFCLEFIYSMSPSTFIATFVDGKLGFGGKDAIVSNIPSKEAVGKWSMFWITATDKDGIDSSMASTYAELHDIALQCRKYPVFCSYSSILGVDSDGGMMLNLHNITHEYKESPHYLMKEASKSFESSSILGKLFNLTRSLCDVIPLAFNGRPDVSVQGVNSVEGILDSFIFSLDSDLRYAQSSDFLHLAQKLHDEYLAEKSACNTSSGGAGGYRISITNRTTTTPTPKCEIFTGGIASVPTSVRVLSDRFKRLFQEIIVSVASRLDRPVQNVQASLSSALYEVSYLAATNALDSIKRQRREGANILNNHGSDSKTDVKLQRSERTGAKTIKISNNVGCTDTNDKRPKDFSIQAECGKMCKAMSRSLSVPWSICGYVLNTLKVDSIAKQRLDRDLKRTLNSETLPLMGGLTVDLLVARSLDELKLQPAMSLSFNPPSKSCSRSQNDNQNVNPQTNDIGATTTTTTTTSSVSVATTSERVKRDRDRMQQLLLMEYKSTLGFLKDENDMENLLLNMDV